jgi:hypothetical protein
MAYHYKLVYKFVQLQHSCRGGTAQAALAQALDTDTSCDFALCCASILLLRSDFFVLPEASAARARGRVCVSQETSFDSGYAAR